MTKTFSIAEQTVDVERNGAKAKVEFGSNPRNYAENYIVITLADGATIQFDFMRNGMHLRTEIKEPADLLASLPGHTEATTGNAVGGPKPEEFQVKDVQGDTTENVEALKNKAMADPDKANQDATDKEAALKAKEALDDPAKPIQG